MFRFAYANVNEVANASAVRAEVSSRCAVTAAAADMSRVSIINILLGHLLALVVVLISTALLV